MIPSDDAPDEPLFATQRNPRLRFLIPLVVGIAFLMEQLDSTIITTAIPDMSISLGTTPVRMNLAVAAYVLTLAVFIPVSGWFADKFGARRIFVLALLLFTIGSALCGLSNNFVMLVTMRALQGLGGAMMTPVGRLILLRSFPRRELVTAMVYMTMPAVIGPVMGPLVGGLLTTYTSWRWIFYINLPFGLIGILLALRYVEDVREASPPRFDVPGFLMVGAGVALMQFGMETIGRSELATGQILAVLAASIACLVAFGFYARRVPAPAVDLTLFRLRSFRISTLSGGICRIGMNGPPFLIPLMLQIGFGLSPIESGSLTFVSSLGALMVRSSSKFVLKRYGFRTVLMGSAIGGSMILAGFALLQPSTPHWAIGLYIFVFGIARSVQFMTSNTLSYADMPAEKLSRATSLGGVLQQLSISFGVSASAMLLNIVNWQGGVLTPARFHEVFLLLAILPLLSLPAFMRLRPEDGMAVSGHRGATAKA